MAFATSSLVSLVLRKAWLLAKTMLLFLAKIDQPAEARHCSVVCNGRFHNEELSTSRPGRRRTVRPQPTQR